LSSPAPFLSRRDGDLLRSVSSFLVVIIHCSSIWIRQFYGDHDFVSTGFFATLLDQVSRFTVPAFFFLSGYGLAQQYMARPEPLAAFYRRRMLKITAPFFLWSALSIYRPWGLLTALPWADAPGEAVAGFLRLLFLKGFDYQYYFLIIIFQFYLIFPFIFRLSRRTGFLVAVLLLQMMLMSPIEGYLGLVGWSLPPLYSYLLPFYGFYCVAGAYAAWHPDWGGRLVANLTRPQAFGLWAGSAALVVAEYWINISVFRKPLAYADHFNRWPVLALCVTTAILLLKNREPLRRSVHENPRWAFLFAVFTPYAFFVYLAHTHLLRLADLLPGGLRTGWNPLDFAVRILFVLGGSYALGWALQALLKSWPRLRYGFGLPKEPLTAQDFGFSRK
jgi:surface polysaccharide O-acyltransferase-like enzyme